MALDRFGRSLAARKQFEYHYKPDFASWLEEGARRTYPPEHDIKGEAYGRPVGVAIDKRGALLVADDVGNVVWRVSGLR